MLERRSLLVVASLLALTSQLVACGGAQSGPAENGSSGSGDGESGYSDGPGGESGSGEGAQARGCAGGSCFVCGDGICPSGYYCDGDAQGGPACGWLPDCASDVSCSCVQAALGSGCSCEERDGGVFVSCG